LGEGGGGGTEGEAQKKAFFVYKHTVSLQKNKIGYFFLYALSQENILTFLKK
jgi:hypothetical protein